VAGDALRWVTCIKSSTSTLETKVQHLMGPPNCNIEEDKESYVQIF
jgi:hypothetical protein